MNPAREGHDDALAVRTLDANYLAEFLLTKRFEMSLCRQENRKTAPSTRLTSGFLQDLRLWRAGQDSNPRPQAPEACALSWLGIGRNRAFYTRPYPPDIAFNSKQEPIISPACDCRQILS
jgi:hypothetical protein